MAKHDPIKLKPTDEERAAFKRVEKGNKCLAECQKHIKVTDRSEFEWAIVHHYQLFLDSEDEKNLNKTEKEVRKDAERLVNKH